MSKAYEMPPERAGRRSSLATLLIATALMGGAVSLGGCAGVNKVNPAPVVARDYKDRHQIVIADAPYTVDVLPSANGGDTITMQVIRNFVARYRANGHGPISLLAPVGGPDNGVTRMQVDQARRMLAAAGVRGQIVAGTYPVTNPTLAAPIRLSFHGAKAKVAGRCGEWPDDLASGASLDGWQNDSFYNYGCASQAMLAAQVADPRDLVTPRGEMPSDIEMRMRAIGAVRKGEDPQTRWERRGGSISNVGGN